MGTISNVTAFATGAQANPFFKIPSGYTGPAVTRETVYANLDPLLGGRGNYNLDGATTMYADINAEFRVPSSDFVIDGWRWQARMTATREALAAGQCQLQRDLALNGTANAGGNTTSPRSPTPPLFRSTCR